jgi:hypothetical protein
MKLQQLYSEQIEHLEPYIREAIIKEAPHTRFDRSTLPPQLEFLGGALVDLGFENLDLNPGMHHAVSRAFIGPGIAVPGLPYKLRYTRTGVAVAEENDGVLVTLPEYWHEAVLVLGDDNQPTHVGSRVRPDQLPPNYKRLATAV